MYIHAFFYLMTVETIRSLKLTKACSFEEIIMEEFVQFSNLPHNNIKHFKYKPINLHELKKVKKVKYNK